MAWIVSRAVQGCCFLHTVVSTPDLQHRPLHWDRIRNTPFCTYNMHFQAKNVKDVSVTRQWACLEDLNIVSLLQGLMKCWPRPCTALKDLFNFKNMSRLMDFHGNTDVPEVCVVGMKSYPSVSCGVMLLWFVKVKEHYQMLILLWGISWLFKTEVFKHLTLPVSQPQIAYVVCLQYTGSSSALML